MPFIAPISLIIDLSSCLRTYAGMFSLISKSIPIYLNLVILLDCTVAGNIQACIEAAQLFKFNWIYRISFRILGVF